MQTSLVSTAASLTAAAPLASTSIKADRPQQLQSVTVYFRGRKMVLMQRPQRRLSVLLRQMLRRSMLNLFGRLSAKLAAPVKRVLSAGALCAMALASVTTAYATATVDQLPINTLPTDPKVISGKVGFDNSTVNQLNVGIGSNKAVINWNSFSIGSAAGVDFHFANAGSSSSVLNRVTGNDPSQIMGNLTSNGKVFLINSAGILVGKNAKVDVAGFVASTLNISNRDFRHGKLHFQNRRGVAAGNVEIQEDGSIKTAEGGSVYLIGANVENGGVITSPKGEVLLAAGKSVDLVDTGTPGVKINVKGKEGKITNLGQIMAATGTIGFGAALIDNGGMLNASSVDKAGGRIFLRASKNLTTSETSSINADGTTGGSVVLYADDTARIDGDVSVLGNVDGAGGNGGYVETSGKRQLGVMYKPRIGRGGEWYIDPSNIDIVQSGGLLGGILQGVISIITGSGPSSSVLASTITDLLNDGTSVRIVTGDANSGGGGAGNITVHTNIVTSGATGSASLDMFAAGNITIMDNVTIGDGGQANHLHLSLVAGYNDGTFTATHTGTIQASNATIAVGGGFLAQAASYNMTGGSLTSSGSFLMDAPLTTSGGAQITVNDSAGAAAFGAVTLGGSSSLTINNSTATLGATSIGSGSALTVQNASHATLGDDLTGSGTLNLGVNATDTASLNAGAHAVTVDALHQKAGTLSGTGTLTVDSVVDQTGGTISFHDVNLTQTTGALTVGNITATNATLNALNGAIAQIAASQLSVGSLAANAKTGIDLSNAGNAVSHFSATNSGNGDITFKSTGNLVLGVINDAGHDVKITATGAISQDDAITADELEVSASGGITLGNTNNHVSEFEAHNASAGDIVLVANGNLILEEVSNTAAGGNIFVSTDGQIGINDTLSALNQVSLTSTQSNIDQASGSSSAISAAKLIVDAQDGVTLRSSVNRISAFSATNRRSGAILLTNNSGVAGAMTLGNISQLATGTTHDVSISNGGTITGAGTVSNAGGAVSIESESGSVQLGAVTADTLSVIASQGSITQNDAVIATSLHTESDGATTLSNAGNSIRNFSGSSSGDLTLKDRSGQSLTLGDINSAGHDVTIDTDGTLLQNAHTITAAVLNVTTHGGFNLNGDNAVGTFGAVNTGGNNAAFFNTVNLSLGPVSNDQGYVTINTTGDLSTTGLVSALNEVALGAQGSMTIGAAGLQGDSINLSTSTGGMQLNGALTADDHVTLSSGGSIVQDSTAGGIVTSQLTTTATGGIDLESATNRIDQFAATNFGSGAIKLVDNQGLTSGGALALGDVKQLSPGTGSHDITIQNAGTISGTGTIDGSAGGGAIVLTSSFGDIAMPTIRAGAGSVTLTASGGSISQTGALTATGLVTADAASNIALNNTSNEIAALSASTSGTGDITVTSHGGQALTLNNVSTHDGNIVITNTTNDIHLTGNLTAGASGSSVSLTSGAGILQSGGVITSNQLSTVAHADTDLDSTGNDIRNFSATSDTGHIHLHNTGALATVGSMTVGAGKDVDLTTTGNLTTGGQITASTINLTSGGDIAVNSQLTASGSASLRATGRITQTVGILAAALNATAGTGMTLDSANSVNSFSASNSLSGDIAFTNDKSLTLGAIDNSLGHVIIDTQGTLSSTVGISASGLDVSAVGDIGLSGVNDVRNFSAHSNSGSVELNNTGSLTLGAITTPLGAVHIETTGGLTVAGAGITAQNDVALTSDDSDLTINAQISAGGLGVALSAEHGAIAQDPSSGGIATNALDAKALTGIALNSLDNHIQEFTARNGAVINNDVGFSLDHNAAGDISLTNASNLLALDGTVKNEAVGGSVSIVNSGTITGTPVHDGGGNVTNGTFADGNVTLTSQTGNVNLAKIVATNLDVNASAGAINQDLSNVDVLTVSGTMTAHARDGIAINNHANATGLNHIAHFSATNTGSGGISLNNSGALLTLGTIDNGARGVTIVTDGNLLQDGGITTAALDVTAAGGINLDSNVNHIGSFAASSPTGNIDLVDNGDLVLGALAAPSGAVNVFTDGGGITQTGAISAISLVAGNSGGSAIVLDNAGNSFTAFSGNASGDMTVKTSGALAIGDTTAGNLSVTAQNNISMTGDIDAADGNVALTSALGSVTLGDVTAGDMTVLAGQGTVGQNSDAMLAVSGELHVEAKNGITLDTADANQVGTFSASNSDSGDIAFVNHSDTGNVLTLGKIDNAHGHVIIQNNLGIIQARGVNTGITAALLDVTAAGGITLDASTNNVETFIARNDTSGDIALTNTATALNLNGTIRNNAVGGNVTIDNTGDINGTATHSMADGSVTNGTFADGKVTLIARASNAAAGNVRLAQIQAADLEVNADGAISQEGSNAVILNISGTMTAHAKTGIALNGNSNATIHNHIANFDATNNGSGDITLYNEGVGNKLIAISNNGGNVLVDNIGALETVNAISVPNGSVTLTAHSPLTIGAGGISAGTGINLSAGDGSLPTDVLTLNGELQSTSGGISLVYYSVTTSTPPANPPTDPVTNPPTDPATNPSTDPVTTGQDKDKDKENAVNAIAPVVDRNLDAKAGEANPNLPAVTTPVTTTASSGSNNGNGNQTAGGSDGEFGGAKDDGKGGKGDKSNMSAPMCT